MYAFKISLPVPSLRDRPLIGGRSLLKRKKIGKMVGRSPPDGGTSIVHTFQCTRTVLELLVQAPQNLPQPH